MPNKSLRESLNSDSYSIIIKKLIYLRHKNNLSQRELANALSVQQSFISKIELGKRRLDILELKKYLSKLNYSIPQLLDDLNKI